MNFELFELELLPAQASSSPCPGGRPAGWTWSVGRSHALPGSLGMEVESSLGHCFDLAENVPKHFLLVYSITALFDRDMTFILSNSELGELNKILNQKKK